MAFTNIPDGDIDPGSPVTTGLMTALRDNDEFLFNETRGLILVERKELAADAVSVTFTGLDGDTDEVYRIVGRIDVVGAATNQGFVLRINGDATRANYTGAHLKYDGSTIASGTHGDTGSTIVIGGMLIFGNFGPASLFAFEGILSARRTVQAVTLNREWTWKGTDGTNGFGFMGGTTYTPSASNLTSIFVGIDSGNTQLGKGSTIELFKLRQ